MEHDAPIITTVRASAYRVPTDAPEADGTFEWSDTTLVIVQVEAGGKSGVGYTYADAAVVGLIEGHLRQYVVGANPFEPGRISLHLRYGVRNLGRSGLAAMAISAIDTAVWDLKARLLDIPLVSLLGALRDAVPVYGSGGFTSYQDGQLQTQLQRWVEENGCRWVKMKVSADTERDAKRVAAARAVLGATPLFIDANGAHTARSAIAFAHRVADQGIDWFEEPVSSDDLVGLRRVRRALGAAGLTMEVAAGEYAFTPDDFRRFLEQDVLDVLQADMTRCGGVTGFMQAAALCDAFHIDLSAHCAPASHLHACCAAPRLRHLEWFHDHVRIESRFFDGFPQVREGVIRPDLSRPGHGLEFKEADARPYAL